MYINNQTFLILGVSKSGKSATDYLLSRGAKCYIYEENSTPKILEVIKELEEKGAIFVGKESIDEILSSIDLLVISPGVPINHEVSVKAKKLRKRIIGELELGFIALNPCVIAVTGTNGKTTTVSLIESILKEDNKKVFSVGNVGIPVTEKINEIDKESICVTEVSSFQLESISSFCPHVGCVLNITPDHLERHYGMDNYVYLKKRLLKNQKESEYSVLNFDDEIVREFSTETKAKIVWISREREVDGGYLKDDALYFKGEKIIDLKDLALKGEHNEYNALFAIACSKIIGIENSSIYKGLKDFKGIPHRIELIKEKDGINYYNDSKATNTASTITAIKTMKLPTVLVLGGSEKGEDYTELFRAIKDSLVIHIVLTGASRFNMLEKAKQMGVEGITLTSDFDLAIKIAKMNCFDGSNLLLSPATASFDRFSGYQERGNAFRRITEEF